MPVISRIRALFRRPALPDVPRWAVVAAHIVPLTTMPSGLWRLALGIGIPVGFTGELADLYGAPGWITTYVIVLSLAAEACALLTLGLVEPWGEHVPNWVPWLRGRSIPTSAVAIPAALGALAVTFINWTSAAMWFGPENNGDPDAPHGVAGFVMAVAYAPMLAWGPLLGVVTVAYVRRRRAAGRTWRSRPRIVILGGGYVGLYAALRLQRTLRRGEAEVTVIDPRPTMTYQPFLAEAAAGSIEPRHVVVSLRRVLRGCRVVTAAVSAIDSERRFVTARPPEGPPFVIPYDHVVIGLGSVARTLPVPGLAGEAFGVKQIEDAVALRNHVLARLDIASSATDPQLRRRELTFVVVGGGYAGVEMLAELEGMARHACRYHPTIAVADLRWHLVEACDRILPEVSPSLGLYTIKHLRRRQISVHLSTKMRSCLGGRVILSDGEAFDSGTIVWTAGVRPHPLVSSTGLPVDDRGRVVAEPTLAVVGSRNTWAAGDNAAVPDLTHPGAQCGPSAQHALRQARTLADNIVRTLRGRELRMYRHRHAGSVASLGLHRGVAEIYGIQVTGLAAWLLHRIYHLAMMPTWNRRARIALDWTMALCFRRDAVSLGPRQAPTLRRW